MRIVFERVDFAYESFGRGKKNTPPEKTAAAQAEGAFALSEISFSLSSDECVSILGRSGSGKSTLMSLFTGLTRPSRGRILIDGRDLFFDAARLTNIRRRMGLVFQFPESQLFETTVYDDVAYGPRNLGLSDGLVRESVESSLAAVGLSMREFGAVDPLRLSQGEKRRAAIAGILAMKPEMLIMDEPTSGLDASGRELLTRIIKNLTTAAIGIVLISHDTSLAVSLTQRALALADGKLCYDGSLTKLLGDSSQTSRFGLEVPRAFRLSKKLGKQGIVGFDDLKSS
jgi:energy-coupling factor transport system ATP-binding protein